MRVGFSDSNRPRLLRKAPMAPPAEATERPATGQWARCLLEHDQPMLARLPAGLQRALQYMASNYHEPMTAEQLARQSHVSVSHLRFLFRDHLGISFKLLLQQIRITHAQRLLRELPVRRVTDVALSVGFNDFSHFHKCFREIAGQTPGDCRRALDKSCAKNDSANPGAIRDA